MAQEGKENWLEKAQHDANSGLLSAGINVDTPLEQRVAFRFLNVILALCFCLSVIWAPVIYGLTGSLVLVFANILFALGCLSSYVLMLVGAQRAARILFSVAACLLWIGLCAMAGARSGIEYYAVLLLIFLIMSFTRQEIRERRVVFTALALSGSIVSYLFLNFAPLLPVTEQSRAIGYYMVLVTVLCGTSYVIYTLHFTSIETFAQLRNAQERSTDMLKGLLPDAVAERVQGGDEHIADSHSEAAIMFADLVGFSELSRQLSPRHLVEFLNELFATCDKLAVKHGVEKIKTTGGCYMAASGVLIAEERGDVPSLFRLALDIRELVGSLADRYGFELGVRIGINTGPVISGVIGRHKKTFDLWGDAVNLASRLETSSGSGSVQVSESTYWRLKDQWRFRRQDNVLLKGVGEVSTYLYEGSLDAT